jgi:hypothetical protein
VRHREQDKAPRRKSAQNESPTVLIGWNAIGAYLGIGAAAAQRWAKNGMPVRREGRFTVADVNEIRQWLGREAHMPKPAYVLTAGADVSGALKESLAAVRLRKHAER